MSRYRYENVVLVWVERALLRTQTQRAMECAFHPGYPGRQPLISLYRTLGTRDGSKVGGMLINRADRTMASMLTACVCECLERLP